MVKGRPLSTHQVYEIVVALVGAVLLVQAFPVLGRDLCLALALLALLQAAASWATIPLPFGTASVDTAALLASVVLYHAGTAVWLGALGTVIGNGLLKRGRRPMAMVFNVAQKAISIAVSARVYRWAGGNLGSDFHFDFTSSLAMLAFVAAFYVVNNLLVVTNFSLRVGRLNVHAVREALLWDALTYLVTIPFGTLLIVLYRNLGAVTFLVLALPLLLLGHVLVLYRRIGQTNRVLTLVGKLMGVSDRDKLLEGVLEAARTITDCQTVGISLLDEKTDTLVLKASCEGVERRSSPGDVIPLGGGGLQVRVAVTGQGALVYDTWKERRVRPELPVEGTGRSLLVAPLKTGERVLGTICLASHYSHAYNQNHLRLVTLLATQAAVILENSRLYQELEHAASTDQLTGLYNHRYFYQRLDEDFAAAHRDGGQVSLILADLDHFKDYNDTYGHMFGDEVLRQVGEVLRREVGQRGIAARYGGEEFVVLTPLAVDAAVKLAEDIRQAVENHCFEYKGAKIAGVTISSGIASFPSQAKDQRSLLEGADQALYEAAKQAGRNRVAIYVPPPHLPDSTLIPPHSDKLTWE